MHDDFNKDKLELEIEGMWATVSHHSVSGSGSRVYGSGFGVQGAGLRA